MANYQLEQTGAEVQAILNAVQSPDTTPVEGSSKLITSGGVQAAIATSAATIEGEVTALGQEVGDLQDKVDGINESITPTWTQSKRIIEGGSIVNSGNAFYISDFIAVSEDETTIVTGINDYPAVTMPSVHFYGSNQQYLGYLYGDDTLNITHSIQSLGASYIRLSHYQDSSGNYQVDDVRVNIQKDATVAKKEDLDSEVARLEGLIEDSKDYTDEQIELLSGYSNNMQLVWTQSKRIIEDGSIVNSSGDFYISDFVIVSESEITVCNGVNSAENVSMPSVHLYDGEQAHIGYIYAFNTIDITEKIIELGAKYIRISQYQASESAAPRPISGVSVVESVPATFVKPEQLSAEVAEQLEEQESHKTVTEINSFKRAGIVSIASKVGDQFPVKKKNNYLCFLHQSDIHGDTERFARMINFANENDNVGGIIETGDFSQNNWESDGFEVTYVAKYQDTELPVFPVIGNHDVGSSTGVTNNSNENVGARFVSPYIARIGAVQGGVNAGYYYRDFSDFGIRLIVINEYEMPRVLNDGGTAYKYSIWARYLSQAQVDWLVATLASVPSGFSVVIGMHQPVDTITRDNNEFNNSHLPDDIPSIGMADVLQDIVDAYIDKNTLSHTYSNSIGADTAEVPDVTVSADFTSAEGEFICYVCGHIHKDATGRSSVATNKQVVVCITTGCAYVNGQANYDDLYREGGTITEDAFNMICFDTDLKEIRLLRIGANVTDDMKRRDYAVISYAQN